MLVKGAHPAGLGALEAGRASRHRPATEERESREQAEKPPERAKGAAPESALEILEDENRTEKGEREPAEEKGPASSRKQMGGQEDVERARFPEEFLAGAKSQRVEAEREPAHEEREGIQPPDERQTELCRSENEGE